MLQKRSSIKIQVQAMVGYQRQFVQRCSTLQVVQPVQHWGQVVSDWLTDWLTAATTNSWQLNARKPPVAAGTNGMCRHAVHSTTRTTDPSVPQFPTPAWPNPLSRSVWTGRARPEDAAQTPYDTRTLTPRKSGLYSEPPGPQNWWHVWEAFTSFYWGSLFWEHISAGFV